MKQSRAVIAILLSGVFCGCAFTNESPKSATINTQYGVSSIGSSNPVWLAASRPGLSSVGKDYLFIGPMSVNRTGSSQIYMWFAVGTTIDRHLTGAAIPVLNTVVLRIDGVPMTFDLIPWDNGTHSTPYELKIESYASYAARLTNSQISRIADAEVLDAYVTDANGRSPIYSVVVGDPESWRRF